MGNPIRERGKTMANTMNPEVKALWVADLRANPDAQGVGYLDYALPDGQRRQCCLGRLCLLAVLAGVIPEAPPGWRRNPALPPMYTATRARG
jgi:hypothetical protein